jgi:hypothetical protein
MARGGRGAPQARVARRDLRWFNAAILVTCVTVAGLGVAMGLYLDRAPEAPPTPLNSAEGALALAPLPVAAVDLSEAADRVTGPSPSLALMPLEALPAQPAPSPAIEVAASLAAVPAETPPSPGVAPESPPPAVSFAHFAALALAEPQAGTSAAGPASASELARATVPAIAPPPPVNVAAHYWVEYAVFARKRSAAHLRDALTGLQLETSVVATHAPDGHRLWRVRSAVAERAAAESDARLAQQKLGLKPLIHRSPSRRESRGQYWVQFGAFPTIAPAVRLQQVLAENGVKASVRNIRTSTGKPLFSVRSDGFPNRELATLVGELGGSAAKVTFIVGRSPASRHAASHRAGTRGAVGSSLPRHKHAPRPDD